MAVINANIPKHLKMAETIKNIFSSNTFFPYSMVTALITLTWWFGVKITTMQGEIDRLTTNQHRIETTADRIKSEMITKEVFELKMENFSTKIDQVLMVVENKK
jgi:hypothetical protein